MLSCSIWFSGPSFWMGGSLESHCVGRVRDADDHPHHTRPTQWHMSEHALLPA